MAPPKINDWNRFEEWVNSAGELVELLQCAGIGPDSGGISQNSPATEWDLNQL